MPNLQQKNRILILIPGNPHMPGGYDHFISQLNQRFPFSQTIVIPHPGQSGEIEPIPKPVTLDHTIAHHKQEIQKILKKEPASEVFLVGHSLGTSMIMALWETIEDRIAKTILLCPFPGPMGKNRMFFSLWQTWLIRNLVHGILGFGFLFKGGFRKLFFRWFLKGQFPQFLSSEYNASEALHNFVDLTSDYKRFFASLDLTPYLDQSGHQEILHIFAPKDPWVPKKVQNWLPESARKITLPGIIHDFVLYPRQSQKNC